MIIKSRKYISDPDYPQGLERIVFASEFDGKEDWALFLDGDRSRSTIVYLHGSFSCADQLFIRHDIRDFWLTRIMAGRHQVLSLNMRGTTYMNPGATSDLTNFLNYAKKELDCGKFILLGGSGGASSAMAYAVLHPENVHGVIAMGMCDIISRLDFARNSDNPKLRKLAQVVFSEFGGTPEEKPELYEARSVLRNIAKLNMSIILTQGENDPLIPVKETRKIAKAMWRNKKFVYHEVPEGDHDSALWVDIDLDKFQIRDQANEEIQN